MINLPQTATFILVLPGPYLNHYPIIPTPYLLLVYR